MPQYFDRTRNLNFNWLLTEHRKRTLPNTLKNIPKPDVSEMLTKLDYELQQMSVKRDQQPHNKEKFTKIIQDMQAIKKTFIDNLNNRVTTGFSGEITVF